MSWYRAFRLAAVLSLLRRYRAPLSRMAAAIAFALTTAWLYADVAQFLDRHHPHWAGPALIIKTVVVYLALFLCFFELARLSRCAARTEGPARAGAANRPNPVPSAVEKRPLDQLAEKAELRLRRDGVLKDQ